MSASGSSGQGFLTSDTGLPRRQGPLHVAPMRVPLRDSPTEDTVRREGARQTVGLRAWPALAAEVASRRCRLRR